MELRKRVKQLRQNTGLSQQKFADCTGFSLSYIQKFEEEKREMKTNHWCIIHTVVPEYTLHYIHGHLLNGSYLSNVQIV